MAYISRHSILRGQRGPVCGCCSSGGQQSAVVGYTPEMATYAMSCGHLATPRLPRAVIDPLAPNWRPARARKVVVVDMLTGVFGCAENLPRAVGQRIEQGGVRGWRAGGWRGGSLALGETDAVV
jgi:hypothetical protein